MTTISSPPQRTELVEQLTAAGQPFELVDQVVRGIPMRVYSTGPQTLREMLLESAAFGDRPFTVYGDEHVTYAEHIRLVAGLAQYLRQEYGLSKGDRIAVAMRNYPEWAPVFFAGQVLGVVVVPLNAWWTAPELVYGLTDAGAKLVVADAERTALLAQHLPDVPMIEVRGTEPSRPGVRTWHDVLNALDPDASIPDVEVDPDDDATILYTSGTTGKPKGAVGSHRNHCTNVRNTLLGGVVSAAIVAGGEIPVPDPAAPQPGTLCTFPLFHIAGVSGLTTSIAAGGKLALQYKWDVDEACELLEREHLTSFVGVPTVVRQFVAALAERPAAGTSLMGIAAGGSPIPPDLVGRIGTIERAPGNGYGLTETTSAVVSNGGADYLARPDSVGRCQPNADLRIVDPVTGDAVPDGQIGELWFRGPNVVRGYWNNPDATASAFVDGWFRTGDLGFVTDDWVYVADRIKDVIIRGGENIYCAEVEAALFEHEGVEDVALVGIPHESLGEVAVAVIVPRSDANVAVGDIQQHVAGRLASFKVPEHVIFQDEPLPRTPTGKILKRDLRTTVLDGMDA
ncbi:class I adenylate-forming enzyme family protein [Antricoccus suffuscus]|uniref:class I adenylate-forming enzyme family protein n=1 Tax=Antricoccus suffuscus TaxID=1629062 RepID=UPI00192DE510|nr:class I adenylate-forming enzyme family protein [Antricoccus suffuscus]